MLRIILFCLSYLFIILNGLAQNIEAHSHAKLSAFTQKFILEKSKLNNNEQLNNEYSHNKSVKHIYVGALIKVNDNIQQQNIEKLGIIVGTKAGNIWTVRIPIDSLDDFVNLEGIDYIQIDEPIHQNLDYARKAVRVDSVHNGFALPCKYTGKNVVVGIIDVGFDYSHPAFYDTMGIKYRIKRVWEQNSNGTPPDGYSYGNEIIDSLEMILKGTDDKTSIHGTHVAAIAAGSGYGGNPNSKYRGIAFESDIVLVAITPQQSQWISGGLSVIIDAINYIFTYAQSQGKPAVVNLSWGCTIGPADGTSLFSQACDNLTGPGKIFVIAAGNNGNDKIHIQKNFSKQDTIVNSFIVFDNNLPFKATWLDIWGDTGRTFTLGLSLFDGSEFTDSIYVKCINNMAIDTFLIGSDNDTCFLKISILPSDINNRSHILVDINCKTIDSLCVTVKDTVGTVNMCLGYVFGSRGYYGYFTDNNKPWATIGNSEMTLGEMATTKSAITVGAFTSKTNWTDPNGNEWSYAGYAYINSIAPFSSHGPSWDNRLKPEICAPGLTLASAINSFDTSFLPDGSQYFYAVCKYTNPTNMKDYYYAEASGTSMAAPMVSGIVALMLQINPALSPNEIKTVIESTAIKNNYIIQNPQIWGAGKINAYSAIKNILTLNNEISQINTNNSQIKIFSNPVTGKLIFEYNSTQCDVIYIDIYNMLGKLVYSEKISINGLTKYSLNINKLPSDTYIIKISPINGNSVFKKFIKI